MRVYLSYFYEYLKQLASQTVYICIARHLCSLESYFNIRENGLRYCHKASSSTIYNLYQCYKYQWRS